MIFSRKPFSNTLKNDLRKRELNKMILSLEEKISNTENIKKSFKILLNKAKYN